MSSNSDSFELNMGGSLSTASSDAQSNKRYKPSDREEEINNLKDEIKSKTADLLRISEKLDLLLEKKMAVYTLPEADRNIPYLNTIEEAIAEIRMREKMMLPQITMLQKELSELTSPKELVVAPEHLPAQGN